MGRLVVPAKTKIARSLRGLPTSPRAKPPAAFRLNVAHPLADDVFFLAVGGHPVEIIANTQLVRSSTVEIRQGDWYIDIAEGVYANISNLPTTFTMA